jgi:hypothetical protein
MPDARTADVPEPIDDLTLRSDGPFFVMEHRRRSVVRMAEGPDALSLWTAYKQTLTYDRLFADGIAEIGLFNAQHEPVRILRLSLGSSDGEVQ